MSCSVLNYFKINLLCVYLIGGTAPYYIVTGLLASCLTCITVNGRIHLPSVTKLNSTWGNIKYCIYALGPPKSKAGQAFSIKVL